MTTHITIVALRGEWVICNPEGKMTGAIGYVLDYRDGMCIINGVDGEFTCEPRWMRKLSNEDLLGCFKSFEHSFVERWGGYDEDNDNGY